MSLFGVNALFNATLGATKTSLLDLKIQQAKSSLNSPVNAVLPSQGIPKSGSGDGSQGSLTGWSLIKIYPDGKKRSGRGIVSGGNESAAETWVLPLPQDLAEPHSFAYESTDYNGLQQFVGGGPVADSGAKEDIIAGLSSLGGFALNTFGAEGIEVVRGAYSRSAANPATEALFKSSNLRTFSFSWNLIPLTAADASNIENFRKSMIKNIYPNAAGIGGANRLDYPAEFEISFHSRGLNGEKIDLFSTFPSGCTEFTMNYGLQGMLGTHTDGKPTQTSINITVQEIYTLVKKDWGN